MLTFAFANEALDEVDCSVAKPRQKHGTGVACGVVE